MKRFQRPTWRYKLRTIIIICNVIIPRMEVKFMRKDSFGSSEKVVLMTAYVLFMFYVLLCFIILIVDGI